MKLFNTYLMAILLLAGCSKQEDISNKSAVNQTSQAQSSQKTKWVQEPSTFMGIEFGTPLSAIVPKKCPQSYHVTDYAKVNNLGELCQDMENDGYFYVTGFKVPPLKRTAIIKTLDNTLNGVVGWIHIEFPSSDFYQVKEMLTIKYGSPHEESIEKFKTKGGAEFDNIVLSWLGEKVTIKIYSLARLIDSTGNSSGRILVYTTAYSTELSKASSNAAQKSASGL